MVHSERDPTEIEALFDRALGLARVDRALLLDGVRSSDPDVVREVESLLAAHDSVSSILDEPLDLAAIAEETTSSPPRSADRLIGRDIGDFRVLAHIGSGGMGNVYEAEQARPRRRVALKVLFDGGASRERFATEAQALARVDHPSIARVYGAGTSDGPDGPVFWMAFEHIPDALPVTEYANDADLGLLQRVELFVPVCHAMHHAHRKGVLHRDLKPANLLVRGGESEDGARVKVIDFGLARLFDAVDAEDQLRTRHGELLGTLRYMSPEQCAGDPSLLDVRTDVYALGLVLYELITGRLPYDLEGRSLLQMLDVIRGDAPADPSALAEDCDEDLGAVLLRALAKDPDERYDSADALADDLERWLAREPVVARRAHWLHRARLFARRRTALFAGLSAGALVLASGLTVIIALLVDNQLKERAADEARGELAGITNLLGEVVAANAGSVLERAEFEQAVATSPAEQRESIVRAVGELRRLGGLLEGNLGDARALASAFVQVGDLYGSGWLSSAEDSFAGNDAYSEAAILWRRLVASDPDDADARRALVMTLTKLADSCRRTGEFERGRAAADEAVSLARRAVERSERRPDDVKDLVEALFARGDLHIDQEPYVQGLVDSQEAERWIAVYRESGGDEETAMRLESWVMLRLGHWLKREADDPEGGLAAHARSRELGVVLARRSLAALRRGEPTVQKTNRLRRDLGTVYWSFAGNEIEAAFEMGVAEESLRPGLLELDDLFGELVEEVDVTEVLATSTRDTALLLDLLDDEEEIALRRERVLWQWRDAADRDDVDIEKMREDCVEWFGRVGPLGDEAIAIRSWVSDRGWRY